MDYLVANKECLHIVSSLSADIARNKFFLYLQSTFKEFLEPWLSLRAVFLTDTVENNWLDIKQRQQGNNAYTHVCTYTLVDSFLYQNLVWQSLISLLNKWKRLNSCLPYKYIIYRESLDSKIFFFLVFFPNQKSPFFFFFIFHCYFFFIFSSHNPSFDSEKFLTCWRQHAQSCLCSNIFASFKLNATVTFIHVSF